jgi:hypothetical protein
MLVPKKTCHRHKPRSTFLILFILALTCSILAAGCLGDTGSDGEDIQSTATYILTGWPTRDAASVQACMDLDPDLLAENLPRPYLDNPIYCETDSDCYCQSGSGVPFVGCANAYHARISFGGCYACDQCACIDNVCRQ